MEKKLKPVYHFISHSHWDREWYKTFETFRLDLVEMINSLVNIFKTKPDYKHFTFDGQAIILEDYAEILPEKIDELKSYILEEKISIGPWYVLADQFLVTGESTVRNLLMGEKLCEQFDGQVMKVGYLPDSFGHIAMMPAILRNFDINNAIVFRGFGGESGQEKSEYRWYSPDGSSVLMIHLPPNGYGDAYIGTNSQKAFIKKGNQLKQILDSRAITPHRLCMNGGDHHFPEPYLPEALQTMSENCDGEYIHSNLKKYVDDVYNFLSEYSIPLPEIKGELRWGYRYSFVVNSGIYSSRMYLKQANYLCEKLLIRYAEPLAVWATIIGRKNMFAMLYIGWKTLLQNHPHDSICGCSVDEVHKEMEIRFNKCRQICESVIEKSFIQIFPDSNEDTENIFIFNPQPREITHPVKTDIDFVRQNVVIGLNPNVHIKAKKPLISGIRITDKNNKQIPFQIIKHDSETNGLRYDNYAYPAKYIIERLTLLIDAQNIPGLGFKIFKIKKSKYFPAYQTDLRFGDNYLENDFLRIDIADNGSINLFDKRNQTHFPGLHIFEDSGDAGDEYNYSYPAEDKIVTSENSNAKISLIEKGPLRAAFKIDFNIAIPESLNNKRNRRKTSTVNVPISTIVYLFHNQPRVEFETVIDNKTKDHRLRILFATELHTNITFADSQFCITKREHNPVNSEEFEIEIPSSVHPMQRCVTIHDTVCGFSIATEGLPEYELKAENPTTLAITLLRCVGRLSGGDLQTRPGGEAGWISAVTDAQCLGKHTFRYAIIPHSANEFEDYKFLNEQLEAFHFPCLAVQRSGEPALDINPFSLNISPPSLVFSAFKRAEDGIGYIVRFYNPTDTELNGQITSKIPLNNAWILQLNEKNPHVIQIENFHIIDVCVKSHDIITLRLQFV